MGKEVEIWKYIYGYENIYEVSNLGNIKSLSRIILLKGKYPFLSKEKILKNHLTENGYLSVSLSINGKNYTYLVHQLVAINFLGHSLSDIKIVVNHINFIKTDNNVKNLEITTQRRNASRNHIKSTSKYVGVHLDKKSNVWHSKILINKKRIHLGSFKNEIDAHNAYQNKLKSIL